MPYLNLDLDYFEHRKTLRLIALCGPGSELCPIKLWRYVGRYHPTTGKLVGYTDEEIEKYAGWTGESGVLIDALVKLFFVDKIEDGYAVHHWFRHAGHLSVFKKRAKSAAKARWKRYATSNATSIAKTRSKQCSLPYLTIPNLTVPNQTKGGSIVLPDWLDERTWEQYRTFRQEIKKPLTRKAEEIALARLTAFHDRGQDPKAIIEQSILNGWRGLFEMKDDGFDERSLKGRLQRAAEVALK